jgi:hypothetical protein
MIILQQNQSVAFINTVNSTNATMTGVTDPFNSGIDGYNVYGVTSVAGTLNVFDSANVSAFGSFGGSIPYNGIFQPTTYVAASAETSAVVKYVSQVSLLPSTLYYFTLTQVNPLTNQLITNVIQFTTPATPATPAHSAVAVGLKAVLDLMEGYNITTSLATTTNANDTLVITANAGFPLLNVGGFDQYAVAYHITTTGVVSHGQVADMTSRGFASIPGYNSANTYDQLTILFSRLNLSSGLFENCQAIVFINAGDGNAANQAVFLGGAKSFFAGYDLYYSIINTTFSSTTVSHN